MAKYKRVFQAFNGLIDGLMRAQSFYSEMGDTVESLEKNVETFVSNRRSEGAQLLGQIERDKSANAGGQADRERDRLREIMERMSMDPSSSPTKSPMPRPAMVSRPSDSNDTWSTKSPPPTNYYPNSSPTNNLSTGMHRNQMQRTANPTNTQAHRGPDPPQPGGQSLVNDPYNPMVYPFQSPLSPPAAGQGMYHPGHGQPAPQPYFQQGQYLPQGYIPPPPPPGPPPLTQMNFGNLDQVHPSGPGGYAHHQPPRQSGGGAAQRGQHDPWAGLDAWK